LSVHQANFCERLALQGQLHSWQYNAWSAVCQVLQSLALQVKEGTFSAFMHNFQHECAAVCCLNLKIVVILARQRSGANFEPVNISSQPNHIVL
jgi:hypothetical protein